jgi:hypothetical protein
VDEGDTPIPAEAEQGSRIAAGERRTIRNPLPEFALGTPLGVLVYRFLFRATAGRRLESTIRFAPIPGNTPPQLAPTLSPEHAQQLVEQRAPTPAAQDVEEGRPSAPHRAS